MESYPVSDRCVSQLTRRCGRTAPASCRRNNISTHLRCRWYCTEQLPRLARLFFKCWIPFFCYYLRIRSTCKMASEAHQVRAIAAPYRRAKVSRKNTIQPQRSPCWLLVQRVRMILLSLGEKCPLKIPYVTAKSFCILVSSILMVRLLSWRRKLSVHTPSSVHEVPLYVRTPLVKKTLS